MYIINLFLGPTSSSQIQQESVDLRRCSSLYGDLLNNAINSGLRVGTPEVCSYLSYVNPNGNYIFY